MKSPAALLLLTLAVSSLVSARADLRLPALISDHAMLQAAKPVVIWGWTTPGAQVTVNFTGAPSATFTATADAGGKWTGHLPPLKSGSSGALQITTNRGDKKTVNDILVGEVWLGGGQSNMAYPIDGGKNKDLTNPVELAEIAKNIEVAKQEAAAAQPPIRYFEVGHASVDHPAADVQGVWVLGNPGNVAGFSAVAWNFAVALQDSLHAPIGLILSDVGNTPIEAWMSHDTIAATSVGATIFARDQNAAAALTPEAKAKMQADFKAWLQANPTPKEQFLHRHTNPASKVGGIINHLPSLLYNGMIVGLEPYTLRGVIWYQADGNDDHPLEYSELFQALIKEWRAEWNDDLPFYFVEMNNMNQAQTKPVMFNSLSLIREQQHGGLLLPGVGMASAIDLGTTNAHFPHKKPVGQRLANLALHDCYGYAQPAQVNGPLFQSYAVEGNKIRLKFTDADGLRLRPGLDALKGFAIRGATGDWVWATGKIDGPDILVWSDQIPAPIAVRYAWANNPVTSVENAAGLPLSPFRTDPTSKE